MSVYVHAIGRERVALFAAVLAAVREIGPLMIQRRAGIMPPAIVSKSTGAAFVLRLATDPQFAGTAIFSARQRMSQEPVEYIPPGRSPVTDSHVFASAERHSADYLLLSTENRKVAVEKTDLCCN